MRRFIQVFIVGVVFLLLGLNVATAQEVAFVQGPAVTLVTAGSNGGFTWGDVNGDGILDLFVRQNNVYINTGAAFTAVNAGLPTGTNTCGLGFADFNGDGLVDVYEPLDPSLLTVVYINNGNNTFTQMTNSGDLAGAGSNSFGFGGISAGPIDHSNYLSLAWPGYPNNFSGNNLIPASGGPSLPGGGIWLLKGGPNGFTNVGNGSTPANRAIDTSLTFESWGSLFFDANGDSYQDLLMPSYRNGIARIDTGGSGSRKGSVLFLNDGTGKFIIPTAAKLGRPIYSIGAGGVVSTVADTGIIVDDTVYHFGGLASVVADFNNDGNMDILFCSNGAENRNGFGVYGNVALIYGKGDGTFTYKWNGTNIVADGIPSTYIRAWNAGDYNNDGKIDIVTADGTNTLLRNNGDGTFTNVTALNNLTGASLGFRAAAFADYNKDGWLDIYSYTGGTSTLLKNNPGTNTNKWLGIIPTGRGKNMGAIGALFTVYSGTTKQVRLIASTSAAGGWGGNLWANFGLGTGTIDSVSCVWPDGLKQTWPGAAFTISSYMTIIEGSAYLAAPATSRPSWAAGDTLLPSSNTFKWNKVTGGSVPVKYVLQIGTSKAMTSILQSYSGTTALTDTFKVTKIPMASKIFWRVATLSGNFQGPWSGVDSVRTLLTPATTVPKKLSPTTNQLRLPKQPTLVCSGTPEAYIYHFQLDTLNRFAARDTLTGAARFTGLVFNDSTTVVDTTKQMSALTPNRKYFWRVRGWNAAGASAYSSVDSFTIMYLPATPALAYPGPNQADVPGNNLVLKVFRVDGDSNYVFQYWTFTNAGKTFFSDTTKKDSSDALKGVLNRQKYYWQVQVLNQAGASAFTPVDSFTTVIELPSVPLSLTPKNTAAEPRKTKFVWRKSTNAIWYHLQVATSNFLSPSDMVEDVLVQTDTTYTVKDTLLEATLYFWHVSAVNVGGETSYGTSAKFTTGYGVTGVAQPIAEIPKEYSLLQNYPNPFNPTTTIGYDLPRESYVKLIVYDVLGRVVATLVDGVQSANRHLVEWNPSHLSSGVYFYRIEARSGDNSTNFTSVKKLLYMK